jgi:hypothetical protein
MSDWIGYHKSAILGERGGIWRLGAILRLIFLSFLLRSMQPDGVRGIQAEAFIGHEL